MTDDGNPLDGFAQTMMRSVRDRSIDEMDLFNSGRMEQSVPTLWSHVATTPEIREALTQLIPQIVDTAIYFFLDAIDNGELRLAVRSRSGDYLDLMELGHGGLAGWPMGGEPDSWRARFSERRDPGLMVDGTDG